MVLASTVEGVSRWPALSLFALVTGYQRYISPHKGFTCAHHAVHGGRSCSAHAKTLLTRGGVRIAVLGMQRRFAACAEAAMLMEASGCHVSLRPRDDVGQKGGCPCAIGCGPTFRLGSVGVGDVGCCW